MQYGILLTSVWNKDDAPATQRANHEDLLRTADRLGFSTAYAGQHFLGTELRYYQPIPWLSYLSHLSKRMRFATGIVLLPMVNPFDVAEQIATLDVVSDGRAIFGVGLGYSPHEFDAFGIARGTKVARFEESVQIIRQLWTGQPVTYSGRFWSVENASPSVLPVQQGGVPIWIGGQAEGAVKRAARIGDAWYAPPFPNHDELRQLRALYLKTAEECGREPDAEFPVRRELLLAPSREKAIHLAIDRFEARYKVYRKWGLSGANTPQPLSGDALRADIAKRFVLGPPEMAAEELAQFRDDCGMTEFVLKVHWPGVSHTEAMDQLEQFGAEVVPLLR